MTRDDQFASSVGRSPGEISLSTKSRNDAEIADEMDDADVRLSSSGHGATSALSLSCGTRIELLDVRQLADQFAGPSLSHRIVVTSRGHQRVIWHGEKEVAVGHFSRGNITVLPARLSGRLEVTEDTGFCCVSIAPERLAACAKEAGHLVSTDIAFRLGFSDRTTTSIVELMASTVFGSTSANRYVCDRALDILCLQLLQRHASCFSTSEPKHRGLPSWHLKRVADYVESRLGRPLSLEDLARHVGLSRFHFCTSFRLATGMTPNEWLTIKRMDRAAHLLANSNLCVVDIAQAVGFGTASAFSACFKRVMGITPSAYRHDPSAQ